MAALLAPCPRVPALTHHLYDTAALPTATLMANLGSEPMPTWLLGPRPTSTLTRDLPRPNTHALTDRMWPVSTPHTRMEAPQSKDFPQLVPRGSPSLRTVPEPPQMPIT